MSADLEREAREAAERWYPPGSGRLGGKLYAGKPAKEGFRERSSFQHGFLAAATLRDKEIEFQKKKFLASVECLKMRDAEIATLRARVAELETELTAARDNFDTAREEILHLDTSDGLSNDAVNVVLGILDDTFSTPIPVPETKP